MRLTDYFKRPDALTVSELARAIGVKHDAQVRQWQHGYADRVPSAQNCIAIERVTGGLVQRSDLRTDWQAIWPEFKPDQGAAANTEQGAAA